MNEFKRFGGVRRCSLAITGSRLEWMPLKMETSVLSLVGSDKNPRGALALSVEYCVVCGDRASGIHQHR